jgi:CHRD domain
MRLIWPIRVLALLGTLALSVSLVNANEGATKFSASMSGFNESPPILTNGTGTFHATVTATSLTYTDTFGGLTSDVQQSHIHFAQKGVNGGIFLFLCSNLGNGPAGTPACPVHGGTVTRTVTAADFSPVGAQNITAGDFAAALRILRSGNAYVNVHTKNFPGGEIRGQVRSGGDD